MSDAVGLVAAGVLERWRVVTEERPMTSSAATAARRAGTMKDARPVVSATNITAANGTR